MPCHTAFLAVVLDEATRSCLDEAAQAIEQAPEALLGVPGVGFAPIASQLLHMTFLFMGDHLRQLPASEVAALHQAVQAAVLDAGDAAAAPMAFRGFELFPPEKSNLVVARFDATGPLETLRQAVLRACQAHGRSLPQSLWQQLEGEGAWVPHVTLGKIAATRANVGRVSCGGLGGLAPTRPARPCGLTLLGERPKRLWCDWDGALEFPAALDSQAVPEEELEDGRAAMAVVDAAPAQPVSA